MGHRFTKRAERALKTARKQAAARGEDEPGPDDLLLGICREEGGAAQVLETLGVDPRRLAADLLAGARGGGADARPAAQLPGSEILDSAAGEARRQNCECTGTEHILFALLRQRTGAIAKVLDELKKD